METTREIALRTYTDSIKYRMQDTPMNWHIWKRAFDIAEPELKKLRVADVSGQSELLVSFLKWYVKDEAQRENKELITSIVERYSNETNCH
jgi:hypothetical protein